MKPNALKVLATLAEPSSLTKVARAAGLPVASASRAVAGLEEAGFVRKERIGIAVRVAPLPFRSSMALRDELARHARLDLSQVAHGARAGIVAGLGFARLAFLRKVVGASASATRALVSDLDRFGVLQRDDALGITVAAEHEGLRLFCQDICDLEVTLRLRQLGYRSPRVLWARSVEALVALPAGAQVAPPLKPGAYASAVRRGLAFLAGEQYALLSRRRQSWGDTICQCLLVPPRDRLTLSHGAIMAAWRDPGDIRGLARWYGVERAAEHVIAFVRGKGEDRELLPRAEIRRMAREYGVSA